MTPYSQIIHFNVQHIETSFYRVKTKYQATCCGKENKMELQMLDNYLSAIITVPNLKKFRENLEYIYKFRKSYHFDFQEDMREKYSESCKLCLGTIFHGGNYRIQKNKSREKKFYPNNSRFNEKNQRHVGLLNWKQFKTIKHHFSQIIHIASLVEQTDTGDDCTIEVEEKCRACLALLCESKFITNPPIIIGRVNPKDFNDRNTWYNENAIYRVCYWSSEFRHEWESALEWIKKFSDNTTSNCAKNAEYLDGKCGISRSPKKISEIFIQLYTLTESYYS